MSSVSIKILNLENISKQILEKLSDNTVLKREVRRAIEEVKPKIGVAFIRAFKRTLVYKGLRGDFANDPQKDVQAHMGIEDTSGILENMSSALAEAVEIGPFRKDRLIYRFRFQSKDLGEYLLSKVEDNQYNSKGGTVYWLEWLINGVELDVGISFEDWDSILKNDSRYESRTGRALMLQDEPDWSTDEYSNFSEKGINFLVDMVQDEKWLEDVEKLVVNQLRKNLGR